MGRGCIYYITKNPENKDPGFDKSSYYEKLDALNIDHVENQSKEESKIPIEILQETMSKLGAETAVEDSPFALSFLFSNADDAKRQHFRERLVKLKNQAEMLTIEDIIKDGPSLDRIVDDNYGDLVCFDLEAYDVDITLDDFIRRMEPGVKYYVYERVIYMH